MMPSARRLVTNLLFLMAASSAALASEIPRIVSQQGRHALLVDGAPYLILGGQAHNSSNYPLALDKVFAAIGDMHANTLEIPVAWEQIEPVEGQFDFSYVDALLKQARQRQVRLVLLWFGTWKNTSPSYAPAWVKFDNARFPRMLDRQGKPNYCLSPHASSTLQADRKAFVRLMQHLRQVDSAERTVIMMQVENEVGTYGYARDFAPAAEQLFSQPVPAAVLAYKKPQQPQAPGATWRQAYGAYADEYFHAYAIASYIEEIAKAGRAVYDLPMYVNNAQRDSTENPLLPWHENFASGGPTYDVIDIYRAAAPHIDFAGPDIYDPDWKKFNASLQHFQRADQPLMVPEMSNGANYVRYLWLVLGRGAIGVAPFGIDYAEYSNYPLGHKASDRSMVAPFGAIYAAFRPMQRLWARWAYEGRTYGVAEGDDRQPQTIAMQGWNASISFREWQFGEREYFKDLKDHPAGTELPNGGVAIAQTGEKEFIIIGQHARVKIAHAQGQPSMWARVEQGHFDATGKWIMERNWNGDQTDYGLNLGATPVVLKVKLDTY